MDTQAAAETCSPQERPTTEAEMFSPPPTVTQGGGGAAGDVDNRTESAGTAKVRAENATPTERVVPSVAQTEEILRRDLDVWNETPSDAVPHMA